MKILFIISTLRAGGAERALSVLASHFANFHDVSILKFDDSAAFYELNPKINLMNLSASTYKMGLIGNFKKRISKIFAIRKIVKNLRPDAVISFMDSTNLLAIAACAGLGVNLVISEHSAHEFLSFKWRALKRLFYGFARALSVLSASDFSYYNFVKNRAVIYNPLPLEFAMNSSLQGNFQKENLIIFVGRLSEVKGCDIFLNALKFVNLSGWRVAVLGDGDERENLENLAANSGLKVDFLGAVKDLRQYYEKARVIVSSSRFEGLGNVLIESLFFQIIRVATPTSGAKELITSGFDGFLSSDFSPPNLAKQISQAMRADHQIAINAMFRADEFKIETIYQKWLNLIEQGRK